MELGDIIDGKYRVERLLGRGGMGAVYAGYHTLVERRVAIKVLSPEVTASEDGMARFAREARAAGRIGNEHILDIYDVGSLPDGTRYMVSEYLDGETLASRLERMGPMAPAQIVPLVLQLLTGLAAAHQAGIVHRDLKPENIFILHDKRGQPDFVKIIDFGISKFSFGDDESMSMTRTGAVLGTPYYLSPEQARGERPIDARSDLYAVGVILYEAVAGRVPFSATSFNELLFKIALQTATPLEQVVPGLDPAFSQLVQRAMARDPAERFQSALALQEKLASWMSLANSRGSLTTLAAAPSAQTTHQLPWMPTASNFGATASLGVDAAEGARRRRHLVWGGGAALVIAVGAAMLLQGGAPEGASTSAAGAPAASTTAVVGSRAEAPVVTLAEPDVLAPSLAPKSAPSAGGLPPPSATVPAPRGLRRKPRAEVSKPPAPVVEAPAAASTAPSGAPPPATVQPKPARDFGY